MARPVKSLLAMAVLALLATPAAPVAAQNGAGSPLDGLHAGSYIRARIGPSRTVSGRFIPVDDARLGIRRDQGEIDTLRLRELGELAVRGRHTRTGAIVGGVIGAGFGTFVAIIANALCETDSCRGAGPFLIAIPAFGSGGALVGAAVGSAFPKWKRVYP